MGQQFGKFCDSPRPETYDARVRVICIGMLALMLHGCPAIFPHGELPAVPFHELPQGVSALHEMADRAVSTTREVDVLVRARTAMLKAADAEPYNYGTAWRLARISSILARLDVRRGRLWAEECHRAGKTASELGPDRVEGHVYLAICSALMAKHHPSQADPLSRAVIEEANKANEINDAYGRGEARRLLGALYMYAPAWPTGVGDLDEALDVLRDVMGDFPYEPLNVFYMAEALRRANYREDALLGYRLVLKFPRKGEWALEGRTYRDQARSHIQALTRN
jgi:hypothetical protein